MTVLLVAARQRALGDSRLMIQIGYSHRFWICMRRGSRLQMASPARLNAELNSRRNDANKLRIFFACSSLMIFSRGQQGQISQHRWMLSRAGHTAICLVPLNGSGIADDWLLVFTVHCPSSAACSPRTSWSSTTRGCRSKPIWTLAGIARGIAGDAVGSEKQY